MKYIADLKNDVLKNFVGGKSYTIDMNGIITQGINQTLNKINFSQLKKNKKIFTGIYNEDYFVPDYVFRSSRFKDKKLSVGVSTEGIEEYNNYSLSYKNEFTILKENSSTVANYQVLNSFKDLSTITTLCDLEKRYSPFAFNQKETIIIDFIDGKTEFTFKTDLEVQNLKKYFVIPIYIVDNNVKSYKLSVKDSNDNFIELKTIGDKIDLGFNQLENEIVDFDYNDGELAEFKFEIELKDSEITQKILFENSINTDCYENYTYFTNRFVLTKDGNTTTTSQSNEDIVLLTPQEYNIAVLETSKIVAMEVLERNDFTGAIQKFDYFLDNLYRSFTGDFSGEVVSYDTNEVGEYLNRE